MDCAESEDAADEQRQRLDEGNWTTEVLESAGREGQSGNLKIRRTKHSLLKNDKHSHIFKTHHTNAKDFLGLSAVWTLRKKKEEKDDFIFFVKIERKKLKEKETFFFVCWWKGINSEIDVCCTWKNSNLQTDFFWDVWILSQKIACTKLQVCQKCTSWDIAHRWIYSYFLTYKHDNKKKREKGKRNEIRNIYTHL